MKVPKQTLSGKDLLLEAAKLAGAAHSDQVRRGGSAPYITHVARVVERQVSDRHRVVAWLHDVVEDSPVTILDLHEMGFPGWVITAVDAITKRTNEPYKAYLRRVAADPLATEVKIADMLDNLSDKPTARQVSKYAEGLHYLVNEA